MGKRGKHAEEKSGERGHKMPRNAAWPLGGSGQPCVSVIYLDAGCDSGEWWRMKKCLIRSILLHR